MKSAGVEIVIAFLSEGYFLLTLLNSCSAPGPPHYRGITITLGSTTFGRTPLDEWSARHRDLYLYNTQHSQQTCPGPPAGLEPGHWVRQVKEMGRIKYSKEKTMRANLIFFHPDLFKEEKWFWSVFRWCGGKNGNDTLFLTHNSFFIIRFQIVPHVSALFLAFER